MFPYRLGHLLLKLKTGKQTFVAVALRLCLDIGSSQVEAAMAEIRAAGYDCFKTSLGSAGVTASVVSDITHTSPA